MIFSRLYGGPNVVRRIKDHSREAVCGTLDNEVDLCGDSRIHKHGYGTALPPLAIYWGLVPVWSPYHFHCKDLRLLLKKF